MRRIVTTMASLLFALALAQWVLLPAFATDGTHGSTGPATKDKDTVNQAPCGPTGCVFDSMDPPHTIVVGNSTYTLTGHSTSTITSVATHTHTITDISGTTTYTHTHTVTDVSGAVGGSGSANYLAKWDTTSALKASSIYEDSAGKVGIGTTAPASSLAIEAAAAKVALKSTTGANPVYESMQNTSGIFACGQESSAGGSIFAGSSAYAAVVGTTADADLQFFTKNALRATVNASGVDVVGTVKSTGNSIVCATGMSCAGVSGTGTSTATASGTGTFRQLSSTPVTMSATSTATGSLYAASPAYLTTGTSTATASAVDLFASPKVHVSVGTTSGTVAAGDDSRFGAVAYHAGDNPDYLSSRVSAGAGISLSAGGSHPNATLQIAATGTMLAFYSATNTTKDIDDGAETVIATVSYSGYAGNIFVMGSTRVAFDTAGDCGALLYVDDVATGSYLTGSVTANNDYQSFTPIAYASGLSSGSHTVKLKVGCNGTGFYIGANESMLIVQVFSTP